MIPPTLAKYVDGCMWSDLLSWRDAWFGWLSLSTKLVVVGLLGEAPELFWDIRSICKGWGFRRKFGFSLPEDHAANWVKVLAFIGWIVIVVGVAGEWESEIKANDADAGLQDFIGINLAEAQKETARAIEFSSVNELEAGKLREDGERLRKDAEELKARNLKLEAQIAPRRLTVDQQVKIAENCSRFKNLFRGKRVKVVSYSLDTEAFVFAEQIVTALRASGMSVDDDAMSIIPGDTFIMGTQVFGSDSELSKKIADAIGSSGETIAVSFVTTDPTVATMHFEHANAPPHDATVLVGLKPYDKDTIQEMKRIMRLMRPTTKPANP